MLMLASALRHLLLEHLAGRRADLVGSDVVSIDLGHDALSGRAPETVGVIPSRSGRGDHHRAQYDQQQAAENILLQSGQRSAEIESCSYHSRKVERIFNYKLRRGCR